MKSVRGLGRFLRPYWLPALLAPVLMALEVAMDLMQPKLLRSIVDTGLANHDLGFVLHTGGVMLIAAVVGIIGGVGCTVYATIAAYSFGADVRGALFRKVQSLAFGDLDRLETGRLVTRLTNDVEQVQQAVGMFLRILVRAPLLLVGSLVMAVETCPTLAPLVFAVSPLLALTFWLVMRNAHALFLLVQDRLDRVNVILQENLSGVRVIKAFVRQPYETARFGEANEAYVDDTVRASVLVAALRPIMMLLVNASVVGVLWFGGVLMQEHRVQVGQILAFINYLTQMLNAMMMVGMLLMRVARAGASAERLVEVLETTPEIVPDPDATPVDDLAGRITFENVAFHYGRDGGEPILQDLSFSIEPGRTLAVLGATGSGKSTLVHLLARLYDVTGGRILLDGHDVRELRNEDLRRTVAVVLQQTLLFSRSVSDNLRLARPDATDEELADAARMAQAHEFISALPEGYATVLGQGGVNLSGGQKQRLALARALVQQPRVLILDDCTSALDATTEKAMVAALSAWEHRCTRVVVAQRIGSVVDADLILMLDNGRVVAAGTHEELSESCQLYQEIVRSQWAGEEEADG